ncbi:ribonuclease Z [Fundicoccus culcitae]|uniref:Ribonuclease Z n=1 Tax=Fundicoccus culcitae TaxID=2969821 RepID=A0ABY5P791_9LACT|nr:ribonuclease Z [Fundicoccus culcitae]UUX34607.1 ribonuclease Z [Fundicoccus culcitae]
MQLFFLGTGAGVPAKARNVSSLVLKLLDELNEMWLFDCGEATQHQILKTSLKPRKISRIFITHMHGDHIFGLPGLLSSRSFQGGDTPVTIYGPKGIKAFIHATLSYSKTHLSYPLEIVELNPEGGVIQLPKNWQVKYLPLNHGILSFGYRIIEPDKEGELLVDKLASYKIPNGPIFGQLKRGEQVRLADGTVLDGKDYIGQSQNGRVVTILGDTRPCDHLALLAKDADALVHECTYQAEETQLAYNHFHSTSLQAAQVALSGNVKTLYLNHISARYLGSDAKALEAEARSIFPNSHLVYDLNEFDINYRE